MAGRVRAVVFDIGETIVSEERIWTRWAQHLGVRPIDFFAVLGSLIAADRHHREVFEAFSPGFDVDAAMAQDPVFGAFDADDLYPDARPCLERLRREGYVVGLAGNQPTQAERALHDIRLDVDFVAASQRWAVAKPSPEFFSLVAKEAGVAPAEVAYVGDRLDNDVLPALEAGMVTVFLRRGPWGWVHSLRPEAARAHVRLDSLEHLPPALAALAVPD